MSWATRMMISSRSAREVTASLRSGHASPTQALSIAGELPSVRYSVGTSRPASRKRPKTAARPGSSESESTSGRRPPSFTSRRR